MKKIILFILLAIPFFAVSQPGGNYYWSHNGRGNCSLRNIINYVLQQYDGSSILAKHAINAPSTYCPLIIETGWVLTTNSSITPSIENNTNRYVLGSNVNTFDNTAIGTLLGGLLENTVYYARAYVINGAGIYYTERLIIQTRSGISIPTVLLDYAYATSNTTAFFQGYAINNGGGTISDKGFCWKLNNGTQPTKSDNYVSVSSGNGTYTYNKTGLTSGATYGVTAYATNEAGTAYSSMLTMTMNVTTTPTVSTTSPTTITSNSAISGGNVTSDGGVSVINRGVEYTTDSSFSSGILSVPGGSGTGSFTSYITGLSPSTTYYVRAFAANSIGTSYGNQYTFTTLAEFTNPTLTTNMPSGVSTNTATSGGHITSDGGGEIVEKGVCYSTSPTPTYSGSKTNDGSGIADFTSTITGLSPNTTYYIRAYARNRILSGGFYIYALGYGQEETFTTTGSGTLPTISTYTANTITASSAYSGGNVSSDGGADVSLRGVCYSISQNPTISDSKTTDGSGTGSFISYLSGLNCGSTYYARAYATNNYGTAYGDQISFVPNNYPLIIANLSGYAANQSGCISIGGYWTVTLSSPATSNLIIPITITNGTNNGDVNYNIPISYGNTTGSISVNYYLQSSPWIASGSIQSVPCGYSIGTSANINIPVCSPTLNIGDSYGGGIIAYIYQPSDAGYISGEVHGIICANSDETFGRNWSDFQHVISTNTGLGYGTQNTNNIVSYFGAGTYAAKLCYDSTRGGYSDWILPSKDELNKLYQLRLLGYGGFDITNSYKSLYWTSSQYDSANAWVQSFYDGTRVPRNIILGVSTRAIRYF